MPTAVPLRRAAFVVLVSLAALLLAGRAAITVRDADISDFRCLWEAGHLVLLGEDPYDRATWADATTADPTRLPPCNEAFIYPLWTAILFSRIALIPEQTALAVWEAATLFFVVFAVVLVARVWRMASLVRTLLVVALWSQPMFSLVANGQLGGVVLFALAALSLCLARGRAAAALGVWLVLLLKPHVTAAALVGALAASRRLAVLAVVAVAGLLLATIALRPSWPIELAREIGPQGRLADPGVDTFWGLSAALGMPSFFAIAAAAVAALSVWLVLPRRRLDPRELLAVLVPVSLFVTPYARAHDQVALVIAWGATLAAADTPAGRRNALAIATVLVAVVLPWSLTALSQVGLPISTRVLVPYAAGLLVAWALPRDERLR